MLSLSELDVTWLKENIPEEYHLRIATAATLGLGIVGTYVYLASHYKRWKKLGIPGPEPTIFFGNQIPRLTLSEGVIPDLEVRYYKKFGKVYGLYEMSKAILVVGEPELLKDIFVRDWHVFMDRRARGMAKIARFFLTQINGDDWKRSRSAITPAFTSGKMKIMYNLMDECTDTLNSVLDAKAVSGEAVDLKLTFGCFTMDVVAKCAFATETHAQTEGLKSEFVRRALSFVAPPKWQQWIMFTMPTFVAKQFSSTSGNMAYMYKAVMTILSQRKKEGYTRKYKDFLQVLMDSLKEGADQAVSAGHDAEAHHGHEDVAAHPVLTEEKKKVITEEELIANSIIFIIAGYETTATLLTYCSYALAMNQDVQDRLRDECKTAFDANGGRIDYDTVSTLKYLDSVISETLRMYSPVIRIERQLTEDYDITANDGTVVPLKKGDVVRIPVYAIHHCEDYYEKPEVYNPDRFMPENRNKLVPYTYLPFGAGPRNCIGMRFALLEAKLAIARLLLRYRFVRHDKTLDRPDFRQAGILLSAKDAFAKVERL